MLLLVLLRIIIITLLLDGENILEAIAADATDAICLNGVAEHNSAYDCPDIADARKAGNWFADQADDEESEEILVVDGLYSIEDPVGILLANPDCLRIVKGWIMTLDSMSRADKMVTTSRLTNWQAMWADRKIFDMNIFANTPAKDRAKLNRKLSGVVK